MESNKETNNKPENKEQFFAGKLRKENSTKPYIQNESGLMIGRNKYYNTPEELQKKVDEYFQKCDEEKKPYTVPGLALHLGFTTRMALWNYEHKESHKEFWHVIEGAKAKFHEQLESILLNGKNNPAGAIFLGKNYGYQDKIEIESKGQYLTQLVPAPADQPKTIDIDENNQERI